MKQQSCSSPTPSPPSKLSMHQDSRLISKVKPHKIRIIHIVAPKIINTEAANFRELVQALTGKPGPSGGDRVQCTDRNSIDKSRTRSMIPEVKKEEEDGTVWTASGSGEDDDSSNDLLNEYVDLDGFIQLISPHEFPFMSKSPPRYHMGVFGDHPQIYR